MYPTVVMVLVETHRSMTDICEIGPSDASNLAGPRAFETRAATLGHLSFAATYSTMDSESESQRPLASQSQDRSEKKKVILGTKELGPK